MADSPLAPVKLAGSSLPSLVRTRGGASFDPRLDVWEYRDNVKNVSINFSGLHRTLSDRMRCSLKRTLLWYAENRALSHLINLFARFRHMIDLLSVARGGMVNEITDVDLLNNKASLNPATAWYFGSITGLASVGHSGPERTKRVTVSSSSRSCLITPIRRTSASTWPPFQR